MSRIKDTFTSLGATKEKALVPFITAGDPDIATTSKLLKCLVESGADIIELGIPFSDPMADGPTIQRASQRALKNPFSFDSVFKLISDLRLYSEIPVILFGYYNPFMQYGVKKLAENARNAGADGFLVVDLPPEEAYDMIDAARASSMDMVFLLAPTSTPQRMELVAKNASGFVYLVSVTGVTGERDSVDHELAHYVSTIKTYTSLPVGVGFGVSRPSHVTEISQYADAVIVGSAIIRILEDTMGSQEMIPRIGDFVRTLKQATKTAG